MEDCRSVSSLAVFKSTYLRQNIGYYLEILDKATLSESRPGKFHLLLTGSQETPDKQSSQYDC